MRRSYTCSELLERDKLEETESVWDFGHKCGRAVAIALACKTGSLVVPDPPDDVGIFISWHKLHKHSASAGHVEHSRTTSKQTNPKHPKVATRKKESKRPERQR
jgi:hypothetical protein